MARTKAQAESSPEEVAEMTGQDFADFGQAVDPDGSAAMEVWQPAPSQWRRRLAQHELLEWLTQHASVYEEDDPQKMLDMFGRAAESGSIEDILMGSEVEKGRELPDCILAVDSIQFSASDQTDGFPFYALLKGKRTDKGEAITVSIGGAVVMGQLAMMHYLCEQLPVGSPYVVPEGTPGALAPDSYPIYMKIKQSAPNAAGNRTNMLVHPTRGIRL